MNRVDEVKFLMNLYEKMKVLNIQLTKSQLDKKYSEQIKRLIANDDIEIESYRIIKSIFNIEINDIAKTSETIRICEPDGCSSNRSYSGSRLGSC